MNNNMKILKITLPFELYTRLLEVQASLENDLQSGETVPSIEALIIDAVYETFGAP